MELEMTKPKTLDEIAEQTAQTAYRLATLDGAWATAAILVALTEAVAEERKALREIVTRVWDTPKVASWASHGARDAILAAIDARSALETAA